MWLNNVIADNTVIVWKDYNCGVAGSANSEIITDFTSYAKLHTGGAYLDVLTPD